MTKAQASQRGSASPLDAAARKALERLGERLSFSPGTYLWHAGDCPRGLYILVEGAVGIVRSRGGRQVSIHRVDAVGQVFGEVPLFAGTGYPASAVAETQVRCLRVDVARLRRAARTDPSIMEALLRSLAERVTELVVRIEENTLASVRTRLALHLRANAEEGPEGRAVVRYGSQHALAERLGTVREVVAREILQLRAAGIVAGRGPGKLAIVDPARLDRFADDER